MRPFLALFVVILGLALVPSPSVGGPSEESRSGVIVTLASVNAGHTAQELAARLGAGHEYQLIPAVYVEASAADVAWMLKRDGVERIDEDSRLVPHLDRARTVVRADAPGALGVTVGQPAVAIIDSGIDVTHPALRDRVQRAVTLIPGGTVPTTYDESGHGTMVAGAVSGTGAESPSARYRGLSSAPLVVVDLGGAWTVDGALRALDWIDNVRASDDIRVVVMSIGRQEGVDEFDPGDPLVRAMEALVDRGVLVVVSAGNRGPGDNTMANEALSPRVLTVGASDPSGQAAPFSSMPPTDVDKPDVWAPGIDIITTRVAEGESMLASLVPPAGRNRAPAFYAEATGTSFAAPQVAGLAARLFALSPEATPEEAIRVLRAGSVVPDHGDQGRLVDAVAAEALRSGQPPSAERSVAFGDEIAIPAALALPLVGSLLGPEQTVGVPVSLWADSFRVEAGATSGQWSFSLRDPDGREVEGRSGPAAAFDEVADPRPGVWSVVMSAEDAAVGATLRVETMALETRILAADAPVEPAVAPRPRETPGFGLFAALAALAAAVWGRGGVARR